MISFSMKTNIMGGPFDYYDGKLFDYYFQIRRALGPLSVSMKKLESPCHQPQNGLLSQLLYDFF